MGRLTLGGLSAGDRDSKGRVIRHLVELHDELDRLEMVRRIDQTDLKSLRQQLRNSAKRAALQGTTNCTTSVCALSLTKLSRTVCAIEGVKTKLDAYVTWQSAAAMDSRIDSP